MAVAERRYEPLPVDQALRLIRFQFGLYEHVPQAGEGQCGCEQCVDIRYWLEHTEAPTVEDTLPLLGAIRTQYGMMLHPSCVETGANSCESCETIQHYLRATDEVLPPRSTVPSLSVER